MKEKVLAKHIFVTGGVASSLGKGLTASSLGRLLKSRGLRVTMQKLDPYINVDPGTMNPFQHGEVFVTDDGGETDLDLGHYERFVDVPLTAQLERDHRLDLPVGARQGAARRVPRPDRAGDPAHHRRDQGPHPRPRRRRRRRHRDHRDRWHRRRHRDPPVPRGHPAVPQGRRTRQRVLRARHAGAVHRPVGGAEDQAHAALGHRAAQPGHPARRHRVPLRPADPHPAQGEDLAAVRRARGGHRVVRRRAVALRDPARAARRGPRRLHLLHAAPRRPASPTSPTGAPSWPRSRPPPNRCASASSASTSTSPTPTCRWPRRSSTAATRAARRSRSTGSRPTTPRGSSPRGAWATSTAS